MLYLNRLFRIAGREAGLNRHYRILSLCYDRTFQQRRPLFKDAEVMVLVTPVAW